ncbi:MAG TPA: hypothetical protein VIJ88_01770 [Candidatus Paceibacterota bacterium]
MPQDLARASATASILGLYPAAEVPAGTPVSFTIGTSGFTNPSYWLVDSFPGGVISKNIDSSGNFLWTPNKDDVGTHGLTITVSDTAGDSASVSQQIVVDAAASITIQSLAPGTVVSIGNPVSFSTTASGFFNPTYSVADSFFNSSMQNYAINASGVFTWTPVTQDTGTHSIVVTAKDSFGNTATASTEISVLPTPTVTIAGLTPGTSVDAGQTLTFFATSMGIVQPTYAVSDSFSGISTSTIIIDTSGNSSWTPQYNDIGMHPISVNASDSTGRSATTSLLIKVLPPASAPVVSTPTPAPTVPITPTVPTVNTPIATHTTTPAPAANVFQTPNPPAKSQVAPAAVTQNIATVNTPAQTAPFAVIVSGGPTTTEPATSSTVAADVAIPTTPPVQSIGGFILSSVINFFGSIFKLF